MPAWTTRVGLTRESLLHSLRTTVAAVLSLMLAHALKLPEFYWAPISTIVILLSPSDPFTLAWQRFAGTALGALVGALIATYFPMNWMVYGAAILVCGILRPPAPGRRLSLCCNHAKHHPANRTRSPTMGRRLSSLHRSVARNRSSASANKSLAPAHAKVMSSRAEQKIRKANRLRRRGTLRLAGAHTNL